MCDARLVKINGGSSHIPFFLFQRRQQFFSLCDTNLLSKNWIRSLILLSRSRSRQMRLVYVVTFLYGAVWKRMQLVGKSLEQLTRFVWNLVSSHLIQMSLLNAWISIVFKHKTEFGFSFQAHELSVQMHFANESRENLFGKENRLSPDEVTFLNVSSDKALSLSESTSASVCPLKYFYSTRLSSGTRYRRFK